MNFFSDLLVMFVQNKNIKSGPRSFKFKLSFTKIPEKTNWFSSLIIKQQNYIIN